MRPLRRGRPGLGSREPGQGAGAKNPKARKWKAEKKNRGQKKDGEAEKEWETGTEVGAEKRSEHQKIKGLAKRPRAAAKRGSLVPPTEKWQNWDLESLSPSLNLHQSWECN